LLIFRSLSSLASPPLLVNLPAAPWSSIWPSPTRVPACCPGWPQTPTPDGAPRAPSLACGSATCPSAPVALAPPRTLVLPRSATVAAAATRLCPRDPSVLRLPRNPPPTVVSAGRLRTRPQTISQPSGNCSARLVYRNLWSQQQDVVVQAAHFPRSLARAGPAHFGGQRGLREYSQYPVICAPVI